MTALWLQDLEAQVKRRKRDHKTQVAQLKGDLKAEHKALPRDQQKVSGKRRDTMRCLTPPRPRPRRPTLKRARTRCRRGCATSLTYEKRCRPLVARACPNNPFAPRALQAKAAAFETAGLKMLRARQDTTEHRLIFQHLTQVRSSFALSMCVCSMPTQPCVVGVGAGAAGEPSCGAH